MTARGRACSTCDNRHEVHNELGLTLQCRAQPPMSQLKSRAPNTAVDMPIDVAEGLDDMGIEVDVSVGDFDFENEPWPHVRPDDWCGQWTSEKRGWRAKCRAAARLPSLTRIFRGSGAESAAGARSPNY